MHAQCVEGLQDIGRDHASSASPVVMLLSCLTELRVCVGSPGEDLRQINSRIPDIIHSIY